MSSLKPAAASESKTVAPEVLVQLRNIHISYRNVQALNGVDFDLFSGEIHALVGEHRAGKSSLGKLLSGAVQKSAGEIYYLGREVRSFSQKSALDAGIAMVYQDLSVLPSLNAIENIFAGRMIRRRFGGLDYLRMSAIGKELFHRLHLDFDLEVPLFKLTQAQQLMVEFARILILDPRVIILDELSNKLTPEEMSTIYDIIFEYRRLGKAIIYITHDIEETLRLADRVTILKNGYRRGTERVADLDQYRLFQLTYSFALGKREIETDRMRFYLLKRYSESFIRHLPVGMVILDTHEVVQLVNFAGIEALDLPDGQRSFRTLEDLLSSLALPISDEMRERVHAREEGSWDEIPVGDEKLVKVDVFPLRDDETAFIGTTILIQDVSIDRYMKDYIIRAEKMATLAQVAAGVAHEINNPLFIIRNYVELLKQKQLGGDSGEKLDKIDRELLRIDEIIGSLLSFSRFKERPGGRVNLVEVVEEALLLLQHNLSTKNISLDKKIPNEAVEISGDENQLKQLFLNLIINSIDAVLDKGLVRVALSVHRSDRFAEVVIADDGYGIPTDVQKNIFNPFFTTKVNKKNTGLGLSICHQIVEAHHGVISFSS
ncbi:MAG TPA: ATP-binding cassette domain-containing protein, partial [Spirochaetia bacterium]|nr:ATP-binding cassette domain-containing protein [Spirochaetia bacterium]